MSEGRPVKPHRSGGGYPRQQTSVPLPLYINPTLRDGEPCNHPGCLNHVTHPCEGCGRVAGIAMALGFTPDELILNYTEWKKLVNERRKYLAPEVQQWLARWQSWDLACSPMDDNERRFIRYGNYLGWRQTEEK